VAIVGAGAAGWNLTLGELHAEAPETSKSKQKQGLKPTPVDLTFEYPKSTVDLSPEDNRAVISNQHQQVKHSWENPGVYAWGSNTGKVAAPDSDESYIKSPRRIPFFDGLVLKGTCSGPASDAGGLRPLSRANGNADIYQI
jgi:hypothetical protein